MMDEREEGRRREVEREKKRRGEEEVRERERLSLGGDGKLQDDQRYQGLHAVFYSTATFRVCFCLMRRVLHSVRTVTITLWYLTVMCDNKGVWHLTVTVDRGRQTHTRLTLTLPKTLTGQRERVQTRRTTDWRDPTPLSLPVCQRSCPQMIITVRREGDSIGNHAGCCCVIVHVLPSSLVLSKKRTPPSRHTTTPQASTLIQSHSIRLLSVRRSSPR